MTQEALKLAIQLRDTASGYWTENEIPIIEKLIELLAQPQQEPVGALLLGGVIQTSEGFEFEEWDVEWNNKAVDALQEKLVISEPVTLNLYTTPPQRKPLTDEQILAANYPDGEENGPTIAAPDFELICFARQIEAAHGIKE